MNETITPELLSEIASGSAYNTILLTAIAVVLILREVLSFALKIRKNNGNHNASSSEILHAFNTLKEHVIQEGDRSTRELDSAVDVLRIVLDQITETLKRIEKKFDKS